VALEELAVAAERVAPARMLHLPEAVLDLERLARVEASARVLDHERELAGLELQAPVDLARLGRAQDARVRSERHGRDAAALIHDRAALRIRERRVIQADPDSRAVEMDPDRLLLPRQQAHAVVELDVD